MSITGSISRVKGCKLTAVSFVCNYVEFHFDDKVLRAFSRPLVDPVDDVQEGASVGWRDSLCGLIGLEATDVSEQSGEYLEVKFDSGAILRISLLISECNGPEAAHYLPGDNLPIEVW